MSALATECGCDSLHDVAHGSPARGRLPSRPSLVLVPGGADQVGQSVRVTRAGRLAVTLVAAVAVAAVCLVLVGGLGPSTAVEHTVTVTPGQTLSDIAVRELPGEPLRQAVADLQLANDLPSSHVSAGDVIVIPKG